jgi:demethylmenaquinone methyltransferase / 2-methoxy-6-polyprenyl-1,4-benzoquinol methylase
MTVTSRSPSIGAQPEGARDEQAAAAAVQSMFDEIAPRYDLLNHVLSFNIDRLWWWRTARVFRAVLAKPNARVLDICCGTGDMTLALLRRRPANATPIVAADFAHQMLRRGAAKFSSRGAVAIEADALHLPVADSSLDLITTAFGFRNLSNYADGLREFHRVLAPGGQLGILDFSEPGGVLGKLYAFYFRHILPVIGKALSGTAGPYAYLPASVERFPAPPAMMELMREAGYAEVSWTPYTLGVAGLFRGTKL